ncbi:MAG: amidohydrolase, partial [Clostridia bacterium]|nr:amidohydrolase [Clostridia bacterium]
MWKKHLANVDKNRKLILDSLDYIWKNPETGYREWKTHAYLADIFRDLGYELIEAGNIPGFYTVLDTGRPGPEVMILGELDSLIVPSHPE